MSSKKITYSSDFKLKVLDYYFKHGGDDKFGLKKKTAGHFNIDKKTVNRMLNNPDMVKRARKLLNARKNASNAKSQPPTSRHPVKPAVKKAAATQGKSSTSGKSASSNSASSSSNRTPTSSTSSTKAASSSSKQTVGNAASRCTPQKSKHPFQDEKSTPGVEIFELPEDPDYSLLKRSINASSNGVASLAKLLVTGTDEVRNAVLNECDVILECKVCRNLFRSVVNFLAHKRIYCQEEFADVRTLFHKGDVQGVTTQSSTVVVEPEPPPDDDFKTTKTTIPPSYSSALRSAQGRTNLSGIDSIALKLARKRKAYHASSASSSTNTGSSSYHQSLDEVSSSRDKLSRDCSVVLEDISGVTTAMFQSFVPPGSRRSNTSMSCQVDEAANSKCGITVAINQNGDIVKTAPGNITSMDVDEPRISSDTRDLTCLLCNTRFATQKTLSVHQRSHHGYERCIYSCPICQASFLSMWAVVKHLQKAHKKTKSQIERLRKVVRKNVRKKVIYKKLGDDKESAVLVKGLDEEDDDDDEEIDIDENLAGEEETESRDTAIKSSEAAVAKKVVANIPPPALPVKESSHKGWRSKDGVRWMCNVCRKMFITRVASMAHVATHIVCSFEPKAVLVNIKNDQDVAEAEVPPKVEEPAERSSSEEEDDAEDPIEESDSEGEMDVIEESEEESVSSSNGEPQKIYKKETAPRLKKKYMKIAVSSVNPQETILCKTPEKDTAGPSSSNISSFRSGKILVKEVSSNLKTVEKRKSSSENYKHFSEEKTGRSPPEKERRKTVLVRPSGESVADATPSSDIKSSVKASREKGGSTAIDKKKEVISEVKDSHLKIPCTVKNLKEETLVSKPVSDGKNEQEHVSSRQSKSVSGVILEDRNKQGQDKGETNNIAIPISASSPEKDEKTKGRGDQSAPTVLESGGVKKPSVSTDKEQTEKKGSGSNVLESVEDKKPSVSTDKEQTEKRGSGSNVLESVEDKKPSVSADNEQTEKKGSGSNVLESVDKKPSVSADNEQTEKKGSGSNVLESVDKKPSVSADNELTEKKGSGSNVLESGEDKKTSVSADNEQIEKKESGSNDHPGNRNPCSQLGKVHKDVKDSSDYRSDVYDVGVCIKEKEPCNRRTGLEGNEMSVIKEEIDDVSKTEVGANTVVKEEVLDDIDIKEEPIDSPVLTGGGLCLKEKDVGMGDQAHTLVLREEKSVESSTSLKSDIVTKRDSLESPAAKCQMLTSPTKSALAKSKPEIDKKTLLTGSTSSKCIKDSSEPISHEKDKPEDLLKQRNTGMDVGSGTSSIASDGVSLSSAKSAESSISKKCITKSLPEEKSTKLFLQSTSIRNLSESKSADPQNVVGAMRPEQHKGTDQGTHNLSSGSKAVLSVTKSKNTIESSAFDRRSLENLVKQKIHSSLGVLQKPLKVQYKVKPVLSQTNVKARPHSTIVPGVSSTYAAQLKKYADASTPSTSPSVSMPDNKVKAIEEKNLQGKREGRDASDSVVFRIRKGGGSPVYKLPKKSTESSSATAPSSSPSMSLKSESADSRIVAYRMSGTTIPVVSQQSKSRVSGLSSVKVKTFNSSQDAEKESAEGGKGTSAHSSLYCGPTRATIEESYQTMYLSKKQIIRPLGHGKSTLEVLESDALKTCETSDLPAHRDGEDLPERSVTMDNVQEQLKNNSTLPKSANSLLPVTKTLKSSDSASLPKASTISSTLPEVDVASASKSTVSSVKKLDVRETTAVQSCSASNLEFQKDNLTVPDTSKECDTKSSKKDVMDGESPGFAVSVMSKSFNISTASKSGSAITQHSSKSLHHDKYSAKDCKSGKLLLTEISSPLAMKLQKADSRPVKLGSDVTTGDGDRKIKEGAESKAELCRKKMHQHEEADCSKIAEDTNKRDDLKDATAKSSKGAAQSVKGIIKSQTEEASRTSETDKTESPQAICDRDVKNPVKVKVFCESKKVYQSNLKNISATTTDQLKDRDAGGSCQKKGLDYRCEKKVIENIDIKKDYKCENQGLENIHSQKEANIPCTSKADSSDAQVSESSKDSQKMTASMTLDVATPDNPKISYLISSQKMKLSPLKLPSDVSFKGSTKKEMNKKIWKMMMNSKVSVKQTNKDASGSSPSPSKSDYLLPIPGKTQTKNESGIKERSESISGCGWSQYRMKRKLDGLDVELEKKIKVCNLATDINYPGLAKGKKELPISGSTDANISRVMTSIPDASGSGLGRKSTASPQKCSDPTTMSLTSVKNIDVPKFAGGKLDSWSSELDSSSGTIDEDAVIQSQTTFGDLSYDHDLVPKVAGDALDSLSIQAGSPGTIDEDAVMQSQTTFGDLSYDYDLNE